jgi:WD40 repeat protein
MSPNDYNVPQPGNDGISSLKWSPAANILVSSNWDGGVRCWEVEEQGGQIRATPRAQGTLYDALRVYSPYMFPLLSCGAS